MVFRNYGTRKTNHKWEATITLEDRIGMYAELRDLYSKESAFDSISKGLAIENIIRTLLSDITTPLLQYAEATFYNYRFDGVITLERGSDILYEIELGYLPEYKFNGLIKKLFELNIQTRFFVLLIAYGFSDEEKMLAEKWSQESHFFISFLDYETLIALHQFVTTKIQSESNKGLRVKKKYFLKYLLEDNRTITQSEFEKALQDTERFLNRSKQEPIEQHQKGLSQEYDQRLENLEEMARKLLFEIQALKRTKEKQS
jgi:hypothetical protein